MIQRRNFLARWTGDLAMGARLALTGGRRQRVRLLLTAVGIGLGVTLLLVAASVPGVIEKKQASAHANLPTKQFPLNDKAVRGSDRTLLVSMYDQIETFKARIITGRNVWPEGVNAPLPPGVKKFPGDKEMVVSPALDRLLKSKNGALLKPRLNYRVVGMIGKEGLYGPNVYRYYVGDKSLGKNPGKLGSKPVARVRSFGHQAVVKRDLGDAGVVLKILGIVAIVVLLLPIGIFIAVASRFGGEERDRRLAALRLVGADQKMASRIAAGEIFAAALIGVATGGMIFAVVRQLAERLTLWEFSVYRSDLTPTASLAVLVAVAVPLLALVVTQLNLRRVIVEPLRVVRQARGKRRRLLWRLVFPLCSLLLLVPAFGMPLRNSTVLYLIGGGAVMALASVAALLPWIVEFCLRRFGNRGGVSWQLAVRSLQFNGGTAARAVTGVAVAVAGAIALSFPFQGAEVKAQGSGLYRPGEVSLDLRRGGPQEKALTVADLEHLHGVREVAAVEVFHATPTREPRGGAYGYDALVGSCADLKKVTKLRSCSDGDVFITNNANRRLVPGQELTFNRAGTEGGDGTWKIPHAARTVDTDDYNGNLGVLLTPEAAPRDSATRSRLFVEFDPSNLDTLEHIKNIMANSGVEEVGSMVDWGSMVDFDSGFVKAFSTLRKAILIGATLVLLLVGASLLITGVEQLRYRRRVLSALVAFGTKRSTLGWSVFFQSAFPVLVGLALAGAIGTGLGLALMKLADVPMSVNWLIIAQTLLAGGVLALGVTVLSMPALWRFMRPSGLRTE